MMTYWSKPSLKGLVKWSSNTSNTAEAEIEITIKCATDGDKTTEMGYRNEGFTEIPCSFLLEQLCVQELSWTLYKSQ